MRKQRMVIDFHVLQTVPPSCVNRDDTGSPKTAAYGGVTRARVSSQAWKHAMRAYFMDELEAIDVGQRTKRIVEMVAEEIARLDPALDSEKLAIKALSDSVGLKIKGAKEGTDALFFMSRKQARNLAQIAVANPKQLKDMKMDCQAALRKDPAMDMVLFGRMVANDPTLNYDAAAQVAHSISTHAVGNEFDYFTAVDDRQTEGESGAAHMDTTEFNSSTLYRYATVNVLELEKNLPGQAAQAVRAFADAFVHAMPTGKQNAFANRTLPDDIYVTIRRDQSVSLAPAFEKPVTATRDSGYMTGSEKALAEYANRLARQGMAEPPALALCVGEMAQALGAQSVTLPQLLEQIEAWIDAHVQDGGAV